MKKRGGKIRGIKNKKGETQKSCQVQVNVSKFDEAQYCNTLTITWHDDALLNRQPSVISEYPYSAGFHCKSDRVEIKTINLKLQMRRQSKALKSCNLHFEIWNHCNSEI